MGRNWKRAQPQGPAPRQFLTRQNYRRNEAWGELSAATRRQCEGFPRAVTKNSGKHPMRRASISEQERN